MVGVIPFVNKSKHQKTKKLLTIEQISQKKDTSLRMRKRHLLGEYVGYSVFSIYNSNFFSRYALR